MAGQQKQNAIYHINTSWSSFEDGLKHMEQIKPSAMDLARQRVKQQLETPRETNTSKQGKNKKSK